MTETEKAYFIDLQNRAEQFAKWVLDSSLGEGVKASVVEMYSETAHFVYEMLQNADDAEATYARLDLFSDGVIFVHNGKRHFSISDEGRAEEDKAAGQRGDINAIVSIGNTSKTRAENKIGKFGIGFKAVFQYTDTAYIYDEKFKFYIERLVVPSLLSEDHPRRAAGETLFYLPFNKAIALGGEEEYTPELAHETIASRLHSLRLPTLFLRNLSRFEYRISDTPSREADDFWEEGCYSAEKEAPIVEGGISRRLVTVRAQRSRYDDVCKRLWLFSHQSLDGNHEFCVGYFIKETEDRRLVLSPENYPAFCFFPTKETTFLNFVIHAPFLLTKSREGIKQGSKHNDSLIEQLAELAASSLPLLAKERLITDELLDVIPLSAPQERDKETEDEKKNRPLFEKFYHKIKATLQGEIPLLPCSNGEYVSKKDAFWPQTNDLRKTFSDAQLAILLEQPSARWVFPSVSSDGVKADYIRKLFFIGYHQYLHNPLYGGHVISDLLGKIKADFTEAQPIEWLRDVLYPHIWNGRARRLEEAKTLPVFLNADGRACAAKNDRGESILFLPRMDGASGVSSVSEIHPDLIKGEYGKNVPIYFGIVEADMLDYIRQHILPAYRKEQASDFIGAYIPITEHEGWQEKNLKHFKLLFDCFFRRGSSMLYDVKDCAFLRYSTQKDASVIRLERADGIYLDTPELRLYFRGKPETRFLRVDDYRSLIPDEEKLMSFILALGVQQRPYIIPRERSIKPAISISWLQNGARVILQERNNIWPDNGRWLKHLLTCKPFIEPAERKQYECSYWEIDGLSEAVDECISAQDSVLSRCIWQQLLELYGYFSKRDELYQKLIEGDFSTSSSNNLFDVALGVRCKHKTSSTVYIAPTNTILSLKEGAWCINAQGEFVVPSESNQDELAKVYGLNLEESSVREVMYFLGVPQSLTSLDDADIPAVYRPYKALADHLNKLGIDINSPEDFERLNDILAKEQRANEMKRLRKARSERYSEDEVRERESAWKDDCEASEKHWVEAPPAPYVAPSIPRGATEEAPPVDMDEEEARLREEYERKLKLELQEIDERRQTLERANQHGPYSFMWFKSMLELEGGKPDADKEKERLAISFYNVSQHDASTLLLQSPSCPIPPELESQHQIELKLHFDAATTRSVPLESVSIRSYTMLTRLTDSANIKGIDFSTVRRAEISLQDPVFLIAELYKKFCELPFADTDNLLEVLPDNIRFVYGPPGTGKTTTLVNNVLLPNRGKRILVLTPTNKAADVLALRALQQGRTGEMSDTELQMRAAGCGCLRFGNSTDEMLKRSGLCRDRNSKGLLAECHHNALITTIDRLSYETVEKCPLCELPWDMVVVDEASMIPLCKAVFALHQLKPKEGFIIAGDPMQIGPITREEQWEGENIYTAVELETFGEGHPKYKVEYLQTQYRSVPAIGTLYSDFAYGGGLRHHRCTGEPLCLDDGVSFPALNLIRYPLDKAEESIYRSKRLSGGSPYHIYAALFAYEFAQYLVRRRKGAGKSSFSIGIISPYRAQADMLAKLVNSAPALPKGASIQVGTVHSFQGDECNAIIAVFNTPPRPSSHPSVSLNKRNILNVAISRARDYLFVLEPDKRCDASIDRLMVLNDLDRRIRASKDDFLLLSSQRLEKYMFNNERFLEENIYSTAHHPVNLYSETSWLYEVRSTDDAIDIQVNKRGEKAQSEMNREN